MSVSVTAPAATGARPDAGRGANYARRYWAFAVPAAVIVAAVIVFPWLFTLFMSVHDWKVTGGTRFVGLANYAQLLHRRPLPVGGGAHAVFHRRSRRLRRCCSGVWAAVCFAQQIPPARRWRAPSSSCR